MQRSKVDMEKLGLFQEYSELLRHAEKMGHFTEYRRLWAEYQSRLALIEGRICSECSSKGNCPPDCFFRGG